jgi:hypothetical protein
MKMPVPDNSINFAKKDPRSQISFGNALAEATSLPIPAFALGVGQRDMEFRGNEGAEKN